MNEGMDSDKELWLKSRYCNCLKFPIDEEIKPVMKLSERRKECNCLRFPTDEGIDPVKELSFS